MTASIVKLEASVLSRGSITRLDISKSGIPELLQSQFSTSPALFNLGINVPLWKHHRQHKATLIMSIQQQDSETYQGFHRLNAELGRDSRAQQDVRDPRQLREYFILRPAIFPLPGYYNLGHSWWWNMKYSRNRRGSRTSCWARESLPSSALSR